MTARVLIVEDAASLAASYGETLARAGIGSDVAGSVGEATRRLKAEDYGAILLDLFLPDGDGLTVLRGLSEGSSSPPAIAITSDGSIARAVEATRLGAFDFLVKPLSETRMTQAIQAALRAGAKSIETAVDDHGIIGSSPQIKALRRRINRVAQSDATVFITGESGVGKELCAQAVHAASARANGPFIALNCGAIPADLLESEMFGHLKGSFTGAISNKTGAAGAADGGTLFLDEICEMDVRLQTKLLRFLETASITPVGAVTPRRVDVRIICATNRAPRAEVAAGRFREDLFYRLHVLPVDAPPLRDRGRDVLEIAERLLADFSAKEGKTFRGFTSGAVAAMLAAPWPGNVRELRNAIQQAVVLEDEGLIDAEALTLTAPEVSEAPVDQYDGAHDGVLADAAARLCRLPLVEIERLVIDAAIETFGSAPKAARSLRVSPSTIYRKKESWEGRSPPGAAA
ncbi:MAG: sigma-54 dependent transcriptional regulator [Pseudomonadota bacterium]